MRTVPLNSFVALTAVAVILTAVPTATYAATCYAKVGSACLKKSYGQLDSSCSNQCAVGLFLFKDDTGALMIMGGSLEGIAPVLAGTKGIRPATCPVGKFYEGNEGRIIACEDDAVLAPVEPDPGAMIGDQPVPEGAMKLDVTE